MEALFERLKSCVLQRNLCTLKEVALVIRMLKCVNKIHYTILHEITISHAVRYQWTSHCVRAQGTWGFIANLKDSSYETIENMIKYYFNHGY